MTVAKQLRNERGIKSNFIAEKVLGVSQSYFSRIENADVPMPAIVKNRLAKFYNVDPRGLDKVISQGG